MKKKVDHLTEDAREAWETSQNPWVYRISSVYETITAETPESIAVKELRVLDPEFTLDDWREDVVELILPQIMSWFLQGKINQLKPWLGESVFKRIAAEITARQKEGVQIDTHVLGIMNSEILACEVCMSFMFVGSEQFVRKHRVLRRTRSSFISRLGQCQFLTIVLLFLHTLNCDNSFYVAGCSEQRFANYRIALHVSTNQLCP